MRQGDKPENVLRSDGSGSRSRVALIVAGPTCSGKSALALGVAERLPGVVINADSMQVYRELHILTARPTPEEEARVPHRLYGVLPATDVGSVAWWRAEALAAMEAAWAEGRTPVLCGGTGMYLRALIEGLAEVPAPTAEAREEARRLALEPAALHERLLEVDPETGGELRPTDAQRLARAWEVWRSTGRGLAWWRRQPGLPAAECRFLAVRLHPDRSELRAAIARRFDMMIAAGAVEEVQRLLSFGLDPSCPVMRAHGVPELTAMLRGEFDVTEARDRAVLATGRYTRRQATWFNHHALAGEGDVITIEKRIGDETQFMERKITSIVSFAKEAIDAAGEQG